MNSSRVMQERLTIGSRASRLVRGTAWRLSSLTASHFTHLSHTKSGAHRSSFYGLQVQQCPKEGSDMHHELVGYQIVRLLTATGPIEVHRRVACVELVLMKPVLFSGWSRHPEP